MLQRSAHADKTPSIAKSRGGQNRCCNRERRAASTAVRSEREEHQIKRDRKTMIRSSGGPVSNSATSTAAEGWTIAPISSTAATMAGAWSHETLAISGATPGAVKIGLQHAFEPMPDPPGAVSWQQNPPPQQSAWWSESASAMAASDSQQLGPQPDLWPGAEWLLAPLPETCPQTNLSWPLAHTHAVLGRPAHIARGIIPQARAADQRVEKKLMARPRSKCVGRIIGRSRDGS